MSRVVLITGAGHGIGAATAQAFANQGDDVVVTDVDEDAAEQIAREIRERGGAATAYRLDVASDEEWQTLSRKLRAVGRGPAVIVNNAFHNVVAPAHELSPDGWHSTLDVSLGSIYRSMHTFHDTLTEARGSMVNVSSVHALMAWPGHPAYAAAKGGVVALTRQLSLDYAPAVRVNAVLPGSVDTRVWDTMDAAGVAAAELQASLRRFAQPEEIASVIVFLAGEGASYVTGVALPVDGGQTSSLYS